MLITAGAACALAAAIPFEVLRPYGTLIRRAEDVTAERHARLVHVCIASAAVAITSGGVLWRRRRISAEWLFEAGGELRTALRNAPSALKSTGLVAGLLIALGVGLRAMHLNDSMAYDESYTFNTRARQSLLIGIADYNSTNNHLLNTLLMHVSWRLFGDSEWALRLPVFVVGCLLLPLIWIWSSRWVGRPVALVTLALVAVSALLITYSTDARGYILVTAAGIALDDAAVRYLDPQSSKRMAWLQAVLAAAFGLCAMPVMLYSLASVAAWVTIRTAFQLDRAAAIGIAVDRQAASSGRGRFTDAIANLQSGLAMHRWPLLAGALVFSVIVGAMYAPAYVFRGPAAMHDQILQPIALVDQPVAQWSSFLGGWEWCTAGFPPRWTWVIGLILGALFFRSTWADRVRWLALPASMLLLHLAGKVAPPPRVYIILLPFIAVLVSAGWVTVVSRRGRHSRIAALVLSLIVAVGGATYALRHPVLIFPEERSSFVSVRDAMAELKSRIAGDTAHAHRLIAPLPCDLPAIFYREREAIPVEINGTPRLEEVLWLLTRHGEAPSQVLASPLINLPDAAAGRPPFEEVARFQTLILHRSPAAR